MSLEFCKQKGVFFYISDDNDIALVALNLSKSRANNLHHSHIFQHQASVSSTASVQTVFHQSVYQQQQQQQQQLFSEKSSTSTTASPTTDEVDSTSISNSNCYDNFKTASNNQMIFMGTSSSATSFQSATGNLSNGSAIHGVNGTISTPNIRYDQCGSISSLNGGGNNAMFSQQQSAQQQQQQQHMVHLADVSITEESLSIGDVADLLHPQYAIITGGRSREGCPIITFPDHNNFHLLTEHDYEKLISYLTSVPP